MLVVPGMTIVVVWPAPLRILVWIISAGRARLPGSSLWTCGSKSTSHIWPRLTLGKPVSGGGVHRLVLGQMAGRQLFGEEGHALFEDALVFLAHGFAHVVRAGHVEDASQRLGLLGKLGGGAEGEGGGAHGVSQNV